MFAIVASCATADPPRDAQGSLVPESFRLFTSQR
jgi:hypothetical protein